MKIIEGSSLSAYKGNRILLTERINNKLFQSQNSKKTTSVLILNRCDLSDNKRIFRYVSPIDFTYSRTNLMYCNIALFVDDNKNMKLLKNRYSSNIKAVVL